MKIFKCLPILAFFLFISACTGNATPSLAELQAKRPLLMAHYMPWYQTEAVSGYWGWHWTMNNYHPDQLNEAGYPQIASRYMPLTGPYDSKDDAVLEYQVLLMKLSGIDGVIVDWYGSSSHNDYAVNNQATGKIFEYAQKAGLLFAICYEDSTIRTMVDQNKLDSDNTYDQGQADMAYLQSNWFKQENYLTAFERPVLFNFGPQYFINAIDWETLFSVLDTRPVLVTLDKHWVGASMATFPWPPMSDSRGGDLSQASLESYLNAYYKKAEGYKYKVGGAFPGFYDIYAAAGVRLSYGYLDAQDGKTFDYTLQKAIEQDPDIIQLITWNDYGEGTIIEPTVEFEYRYLEMLQAVQPQLGNSKFKFTADDLRLPLQIYKLRKQTDDPDTNAELDKAFAALLDGSVKKAQKILDRLKP
jgi:hypothetical protein